MTTQVLAELAGNTHLYGRKNDRKVYERYQELIASLGIRKVFASSDLDLSKLNEINELTLFILPRVRSHIYQFDSNFVIEGYKFILYNFLNMSSPLLSNARRIVYNNKTLAHVIGNAIILYFNPFPTIPRINPIKTFIDFMRTNMKAQNIEIKKIEIKQKTPEELLKINAEKFLANFNKILSEKAKSLQYIETDITNAQNTILRYLQEYSIANIEFQSMLSTKDKMDTLILQKISELNDLNIVKDVKLTEEGILIDFGEISINEKGTDYYIGHITCNISPTGFSFDNLNNKRKGYIHPHINSSGPCFGTYSTDINKMLATLDLKKLVFTLAQYLRTYNKNSPYQAIGAWSK